jgi:hypothetical protein
MFKITVEEIVGEGDDQMVDIVYQQLREEIDIQHIISAVNIQTIQNENGKERGE